MVRSELSGERREPRTMQQPETGAGSGPHSLPVQGSESRTTPEMRTAMRMAACGFVWPALFAASGCTEAAERSTARVQIDRSLGAIERCIRSGTDCVTADNFDAATAARLRAGARQQCLRELGNVDFRVENGAGILTLTCRVDEFLGSYIATYDLDIREEVEDPVVTYGFKPAR
jgi:hypothetical protein